MMTPRMTMDCALWLRKGRNLARSLYGHGALAAACLVAGLALPAQQADAPKSGGAESGAAKTGPKAKANTAAASAPERVHIIGASVSGGFRDGPLFGAKTQGETVALRKVLKAWGDGEWKVTTHPQMEMWNLFQDPIGIGRKQVNYAKRRKPDLVVAIDFPFWFAYGYMRGDRPAARAARLKQGLAYLAEFEVPVLIGDLPDMTGAAMRMLKTAQIPGPKVLADLNAQIAAFAAEHKNVSIVPIAAIVKEMKDDGVVLPLDGGKVRIKPGALLQEDRLHATRLGVALLSFRLQDALRAQFPKDAAGHSRRWSFEQFVEVARAEDELEGLVEEATAGAGK
ncbi:MAG: hypothetical protein AB8H80_18660 [Planctomycetota bacterium]